MMVQHNFLHHSHQLQVIHKEKININPVEGVATSFKCMQQTAEEINNKSIWLLRVGSMVIFKTSVIRLTYNNNYSNFIHIFIILLYIHFPSVNS